VLLDRGRVAAAGPIEEVLTPARIEQVFGVRAERLSTAGGAPLFAFGARE
jgi:iron complex transport system ATP-binding protein